MAKRPTKVSFEPDGEDLDPGLREAPQMQIYKESPLLSAFDPVTGSTTDRLTDIEDDLRKLREELAQHEADRRTELAAELDKHITIWARGRITQEHVRRTLLALIDKL